MNKLRLLVATAVSSLYLCVFPLPCLTAEILAKDAAQDSVLGGVTGILSGVTTRTFTRRPDDSLQYLAPDAAAGITAGVAEDAESSSALLEVDNGKVRFGIPIVIPDVKDSARKTTVVVIAEIIKGRF